jgi:nucleotide-binding universal stress UspA family protein
MGGAPAPGGIVRVPEARTVETKAQAFERARDQLTNYLEACAVPLRASGQKVEIVVRFGEVVEEILAAARESDAEVIMMATHGHTGLAQAIFGSVASRVVGSGIRPVFLLRPREIRADDEGVP